jgi:hypothetical protein
LCWLQKTRRNGPEQGTGVERGSDRKGCQSGSSGCPMSVCLASCSSLFFLFLAPCVPCVPACCQLSSVRRRAAQHRTAQHTRPASSAQRTKGRGEETKGRDITQQRRENTCEGEHSGSVEMCGRRVCLLPRLPTATATFGSRQSARGSTAGQCGRERARVGPRAVRWEDWERSSCRTVGGLGFHCLSLLQRRGVRRLLLASPSSGRALLWALARRGRRCHSHAFPSAYCGGTVLPPVVIEPLLGTQP